jgi:hypothetical protein
LQARFNGDKKAEKFIPRCIFRSFLGCLRAEFKELEEKLKKKGGINHVTKDEMSSKVNELLRKLIG